VITSVLYSVSIKAIKIMEFCWADPLHLIWRRRSNIYIPQDYTVFRNGPISGSS